TLQIMKQLTSAMAHAHENGIIHRDIKPQNVLMNEDGSVKVADFGIATSLNATGLTQTNSVMGTVHYLSPEQARGGIATKRSDIYSLGIVMYEMLTGELPFSGESAVSIALKHLQSETPSVRDFDATIPQSVENVVLKATAKDPSHRYNSAEEMMNDLTTALSPNRLNESKYAPDLDDEATKAMPIIKDRSPIAPNIVQTKAVASSEPVIDEKKPAPSQQPVVPVPAPKKRKKWPIILVSVFLLIVAAIVLIAALTPNKVEIPDVANMTIEEATELLEEKGFVIGEQIDQFSEEVEEGIVIKTDPKAGLSRVKGSEISLVVSLGDEAVEMPNYVGRNQSQVIPMIEGEEFEGYEIVEKYDDAEAGTVIEQEPKAGDDIVIKKTKVVLTVSKGKELGTVTDLTGFNQAALNEYAKSSGYKIKIGPSVFSNDIPTGSVVSQKIAAGTKLAIGETIEVSLSKGPEAKAVKTHIKTVLIPYEVTNEDGEQPEQKVPQTVKIYIQDNDHSMVDAFEEMTITADTNYRVKLVIAEGEKAAYRIMRDGTVIAEETISYNQLP
ncbi:MAG: Stk1 family PASTA domain-containing Ser/Thr kinase, partial [Lysinibacillus sp.]